MNIKYQIMPCVALLALSDFGGLNRQTSPGGFNRES